jgi:hypothetical protein
VEQEPNIASHLEQHPGQTQSNKGQLSTRLEEAAGSLPWIFLDEE